MFTIDPRQQNAKFRCDTRSRLLLQAALAQHAFEQRVAFNQACPGNARRQIMSKFAF